MFTVHVELKGANRPLIAANVYSPCRLHVKPGFRTEWELYISQSVMSADLHNNKTREELRREIK